MKEDETIDQMYGRFTIIINELNSLGKTYTAHERVRKILRSLPKDWRHIVIAITDEKNLSQLKLEDLIGSLKAHESIIQEDKPTKKKMIALESQVMEHSQNNLITDNGDLLQEDDEEEFALISRRIQRLMMRRNQIRNSSQNRRNNTRNESDLSKVQCYGCNQFGHYKNDCPKQRQKSPLKNKSMMAT
ncbi:phytoalexin-deficient 4-2 protein [Trifolium pratense]|uniref:Phytoalexin-deficient 4-2 protein n=1 Tax=Trifolium pratense TaxID=57577 RepID=A0A2K3K009_TRIPR|nr:phytoalexin-deficient 4-2 protein [Trifolium pratense]